MMREGILKHSFPVFTKELQCVLSDDPHFILTITQEDVQQQLLKLGAWKSGLNNRRGRAGKGILHR